MQCGELDRNAGSGDDAAPIRRVTDRVDRGLVGDVIPVGIGSGQRRLAEHVVGERVAARLALARIRERLADRAAGDELAPQEPHREIDALANQRLAAFAQQRGECLLEHPFAARLDDPAGDEQPPRRRIHEQRRGRPDVRGPIAAGKLVADQPVARPGVRNAQQRLGEAHQRDALAAVERGLEHQRVDAARLRARRTHRRRQRCRRRLRPGELVRREAGFGEQCPYRLALVGAVERGDALAQRRECAIGCPRIVDESEIEILPKRNSGWIEHERLPEGRGREGGAIARF